MQDLLREFIKRPNYKWSELPEKAKISGFWWLCVMTVNEVRFQPPAKKASEREIGDFMLGLVHVRIVDVEEMVPKEKHSFCREALRLFGSTYETPPEKRIDMTTVLLNNDL